MPPRYFENQGMDKLSTTVICDTQKHDLEAPLRSHAMRWTNNDGKVCLRTGWKSKDVTSRMAMEFKLSHTIREDLSKATYPT